MKLTALPRMPLLGGALLLSACAGLSLADVLQPPQFSEDPNRAAEIRLLGPSTTHPTGGAAVRLWTRVHNPNAFWLTLSQLDGTLFLEGGRAATVDLPLGLPMPAAHDTIIPIDIAFSFSDLPRLAEVAARAVTGGAMTYVLEGTVAVDAGDLGEPRFGPMEIVAGELQVTR